MTLKLTLTIRISKVFSGVDFDIDPTNPEFRPTEGMQEVLKKKRHRKAKKLKEGASAAKPVVNHGAAEGPAIVAKPSSPGSTEGLALQLFATKRPRTGGDGRPATGSTSRSAQVESGNDFVRAAPSSGKKKRRRT